MGAGVVSPRDPVAFREKVLRRAMQLDRRRRRARAFVVVPALLAVVLAGVLAANIRGSQRADVVASQPAADGVLETRVVALEDGMRPWSVVGGADGEIWVLTRSSEGSALVRVKADDHLVIPLPEGAQPDMAVSGTDGGLWLTDPAGQRVLRVSAEGEVRAHPLSAMPSPSATFGPDGRFWFAEPAFDRLTGMAPDGDLLHRELPPGRQPTAVAAGPDGSIWFGQADAPRIGSVAATGAISEFDLAGADERVAAMAIGPGPALWMTIRSGSGPLLGRVDARGGVVEERLPGGETPTAISAGPDGGVWFTLSRDATLHQRSLARLSQRPLDRRLLVDSWALSENGVMWAVDRAGGQLIQIPHD